MEFKGLWIMTFGNDNEKEIMVKVKDLEELNNVYELIRKTFIKRIDGIENECKEER